MRVETTGFCFIMDGTAICRNNISSIGSIATGLNKEGKVLVIKISLYYSNIIIPTNLN